MEKGKQSGRYIWEEQEASNNIYNTTNYGVHSMKKGRRRNGDRPKSEARGESPVDIDTPPARKQGRRQREKAPYLHYGIQNMEHVLGSKMAVRVFVEMVNGYDDAGGLGIHHDETCWGGLTGVGVDSRHAGIMRTVEEGEEGEEGRGGEERKEEGSSGERMKQRKEEGKRCQERPRGREKER